MSFFSSLLASATCLLILLVALVTSAPTGPFLISSITSPQSLENLAVRHSGELLVTSAASNKVFMVFPDGNHDPIPIAEFDGANATLGIAELVQDVFYVIAARVNGLTMISGSVEIWKADLRAMTLQDGIVSQPAEISLVTAIPEAQLFNGLCPLSKNDKKNLLISDSVAGTITRLNVETLEYATVIDDDLMRMATSSPPLGIDGIRTFGDTLYFTNFNQGFFASIPISLSDGTATGPVKIIANISSGDDFTLTPDGKNAIVAQNGPMNLSSIDLTTGSVEVIANSDLLSAATSAAFGRRCVDKYSIYVSSDGGSATGSVVRVDL